MRRLLATVAVALAFPATAAASLPQVDYSLSGPAGENGWYRGAVTITWTVTGATGAACQIVETITIDTPGVQRACTAWNADGTVPAQTKVIKIDATPPANLVATPARPPDAAPFYTAPVPITWSAADPTSGVASCTASTYAGPDGAAVAQQGSCRDRAGNVSAPLGIAFAYDATAPPLGGVSATPRPDGRIAVAWTADADAQTVAVVRQPDGRTVLDGPATTRTLLDGPLAAATTYTYAVTVRDAAGHATTASASATAKKAARPTLRWKARRGAKYYNVQLFRNGRKVLSAWPTVNRYTLRASWRHRGRRHTLTAGRYRWYVWPGYGPRAAHRYGRLLAKGVVTRP